MTMNRVIPLLLILAATSAGAQEYMKAAWYGTKNQVIKAEGAPIAEEDAALVYEKTLWGHPFQSKYLFQLRMLSMIEFQSESMSTDDIIDTLIEKYGRPFKTGKIKVSLFWQTIGGWLVVYSEAKTAQFRLYPQDYDPVALHDELRTRQ